MGRPVETGSSVGQSVLERLSTHVGIEFVLCDARDSVVWASRGVASELPGVFLPGVRFEQLLARQVLGDPVADAPGGASGDSPGPGGASGVYRLAGPGGEPLYYRHVPFEFDESGERWRVHCLVNVTGEKQLETTLRENLRQLASMKEIMEVIHESTSTQEVLYMILVALTAHMGFGFNRAFYLEVRGLRLKGRIGIGPSSGEDAHRIWGRLAALRLPSLRAIYEDLIRDGRTPDPETQAIAARMDFPIRPTPNGLLGVIEQRRPALVRKAGTGTEVDNSLFELLRSDEVAAVPLNVRDRVVGVLIADNFITRQAITERDLSVLKSFSGYAGVALERSRLYDELRQQVAETRAANEELRTHQRRLLQAEKLSAIGELAACVSHEIRNPMVAIGGLARSLMKDSSLGEEQRETLRVIAAEVARLEKFLGETLDFVKPEVSGTEPLDLRAVVEGVLEPLRTTLAEREIELEVDLGPEPIVCQIDRGLLRRAVSNVVQNSIDAVGREGRIRVRASRRDHSGDIEIADTGPGIAPEIHPRIFEPYFTTKARGTGLGLAIASQGIRSLGGAISLQEGTAGRTIFQITLPLPREAQASARETDPARRS